MQYGLYISASGAMNAIYRQDLHASNLANVNTVGFKPDASLTRQRDPVRLEDDLPHLPSNAMLERLGAGVMAVPNTTSFSQGAIRQTGNDLDLAIRGDGFFSVIDPTGEPGHQVKLTRDGRFTLDANSRLVSVATGMAIADPSGREVRIPGEGHITVHADGRIEQEGQTVARIAFHSVNPDAVRKGSNGLFEASAQAMASRAQASGSIEQGAVEESAVNEIATLMSIRGASRDAQANIGMITYQDRLMDQAINRFARVS